MFPANRQPPALETDVSHFHGTTLLSPIRVEMNRHGPPHGQFSQYLSLPAPTVRKQNTFKNHFRWTFHPQNHLHNGLNTIVCSGVFVLILINLDTAKLYGHTLQFHVNGHLFRHAFDDWRLCARCTNTSTAEGVMSSTFYLSVWLSFLSVCAANNALKACWNPPKRQ